MVPYLRGPRRATEAELTRLTNITPKPVVPDSAVARALAGDAILGEAVRRIREHFSPAQVVLFGSRARGEADASSDYDLLVVLRGAVDWRAAGRIYGVLRGLDANFDILTESMADWQRLRELGPSFEHRIATEGVDLISE